MFKRLFVANRGEVAARIVRACSELQIETVCGASTADLEANYQYLQQADAVVCIGGSAPSASYLQLEQIVQAAKQTQCSALHPGWGFLAENSLFAALCEQHGITFIGPDAATMDIMALKVPARAAAMAAGLPVVPGSDGILDSPQSAIVVANQVGYPVVLKADAGGGGRGIRRCNKDSEVTQAFADAAREAQSAFGNAALYLEKYIVGGRHIEFQILGDGRGNAIHLGERECSIQRRHQKLLEEAPSPMMSDEQRNHYGDLSAKAAASFNYAGAGTIEYLLDEDGSLFFLEMNTRLQVEHPVSESITGMDLMQQQIIIAAGGSLPCTQDEVTFKGHSIELRVNAEDTNDDFRPTPGQLTAFAINGDGIRFDTHLQAGDSVPPFYDSLLGKVITHADTREQCIKMLVAAIGDADIEGLPTTLGLQRDILLSDDFKNARCDTLWLDSFLSGNK
jgi:acetyl-CoA carboxylase biotin carboxylase subunit